MSGNGQDGDGPGSGSSTDYGYGSGSQSTSSPYSPSPFAPGSSSIPSTGGPYGDSSHMTPYGQPGQSNPYAQTYGAPRSADPYAGAYPSENYARPSNTLALLSLIFSLVGLGTSGLTCIVGVILGHVARSQIKRTGETGGGLALAGLIVGYSILGLGAAGLVFYLLAMVFAFTAYA